MAVRPIRPDDKDAIKGGFERLSDRSRYLRFLAPMPRLTASQLRYLTEIDHHDHEALIAFDAGSRDGVGVARFVRLEDGASAEAAVTVVDDWQGRGLGTVLTWLLAERAREEGVARFTTLLLAENESARGMLDATGATRVTAREGSNVEIAVDIPEEGIGAHMHGVLRAVAGGPAELAEPPGRWHVLEDEDQPEN